MSVHIILGDKNPEMIKAWEHDFAGLKDVTIRGGNLLLTKADALVSPANSFGFMDGGIDWAISDMMEWKIQPIVQELIRTKYDGELLVGQADIVATNHSRFPYLVCAPTMRVPQPVKNTMNAFLAMRATLVAVNKFNEREGPKINSVAIPGLCTGVGLMPREQASKQMRAAYDLVKGLKHNRYSNLLEAINEERRLTKEII